MHHANQEREFNTIPMCVCSVIITLILVVSTGSTIFTWKATPSDCFPLQVHSPEYWQHQRAEPLLGTEWLRLAKSPWRHETTHVHPVPKHARNITTIKVATTTNSHAFVSAPHQNFCRNIKQKTHWCWTHLFFRWDFPAVKSQCIKHFYRGVLIILAVLNL